MKRLSEEIGLKPNPKKCVIFTDLSEAAIDPIFKDFVKALPSPGDSASPCLKTLGAYVGRSDRDEAAALLADYKKKDFDTFLRRISMARGPWASAVFSSCGIPKLNHMLRTHSPGVTADLAEMFDQETDVLIATWLDTDVAAVHKNGHHEMYRAFKHLPIAQGGLGFTSLSAIARPAYEASYESINSGGVRSRDSINKSQRAKTLPINEELIKFIDNDKIMKLHRKHNMSPGAGLVVRDPTYKCTDQAWRLSLAFRSAAQIRGIQDLLDSQDGVKCPGCHTSYKTWIDFIFHAAYCARVPGHNVSAGHALIKDELKNLFHLCGVPFDAAEPRSVRTTTCSGCKSEIPELTWEQHRDSCPACTRHTPTPRGSGPDIRIRPNGVKIADKNLAFSPMGCCIDVTQVGTRCASYDGKPVHEIFALREDIKKKKYLPITNEAQEELLVFAVNESGQLNRDADKLLEFLAQQPRAPAIEVLRRRIKQAALRAHGNALTNVMRQLRLNSSDIFNSTPLSETEKRKRFLSELEIIKSNPDIKAANMSQHFALPVAADASKVIARRFVADELARRRSRDAGAADATAEIPSVANLPDEEIHRLAGSFMRERNHSLTREQHEQVTRNELLILQSGADSIRFRETARQAVSTDKVLFLGDAHSPIRQDRSRSVIFEQDILHVFTKDTPEAVNAVTSDFYNRTHSPDSFGALLQIMFYYVLNLITHQPNGNVFARDRYITVDTLRKLWIDLGDALSNPANTTIPNRVVALRTHNLWSETISFQDENAIRNLVRLFLFNAGRLSNAGLYIPSPAPSNSTPAMSQQNNSSETTESVSGARKESQQQVEEN